MLLCTDCLRDLSSDSAVELVDDRTFVSSE